jgi:hypothetical protein
MSSDHRASTVSRAPLFAASALTIGLAAGAAYAQDTLLVHYMPWFQSQPFSGYWGPHWTGFNNEHDPTALAADGLPDIYSKYDPLIGLYDSSDPDLLECHLLMMKLAGIDGVIVDWYGTSNAFNYPVNQQASIALFNAAEQFGMQFAVCYEDRTIGALLDSGQLQPSQIESRMSADLQWVEDNWFASPIYAQKGGQPLLLNFGPITVQSPATWNNVFQTLNADPNFFSLHNLWTQSGADGAFMWVHFNVWNDGNPSTATIKQRYTNLINGVQPDPAKIIPAAKPGFDDAYQPPGRFEFLDHRNGQTLRESLEVGMEGPWETIQLVTWNDFTEGTMIEPTVQFGYTFLEVIQQERIEESGGAFPFDADDLRLPAQLYGLRKSGSVPAATLDQISQQLSGGLVEQARAALAAAIGDVIETQPVDAVAEAGGELRFEASLVPGLAGVSLQWTRDGVPLTDGPNITGANTATLIVSPASARDIGGYRLTATVGSVVAASDVVVGAVRAPADVNDLNWDGIVDIIDVIDLTGALD